MASIADVLSAAREGTLTISECLDLLQGSEGVAASALWGAPGHALQHSAQEVGAEGFRELGFGYHFRGPIPLEKQLQGGPNVGQFRAAVKVESDGSVTPKAPTFHSQFQDDHQSAMCLKLLLQSKAGLWALDLLRNNARVSVSVTFGMPGGTQYLSRAAHLMADSNPTSAIKPQADVEDNRNFVLIDRRDMGAVVGVLRARSAPLGHLHVQTLYPTSDSVQAGSSEASVDAKTATDYSGPASVRFA